MHDNAKFSKKLTEVKENSRYFFYMFTENSLHKGIRHDENILGYPAK
jgi:hypothetical protein